MSEDQSRDRESRKGLPPLERLLGALGAVLVLALLTFLVYQSAVGSETGPELSTEVSRIAPAGDQFVAHVRVRNRGGETAESVSVSGDLRVAGTRVGQASTTIAHIPANSSRQAALVFERDPRDGRLDVRAEGYALP